MTGWKIAVKYTAMALAILMAVSIIGGIISAVTSMTFIFGGTDSIGELKSYEIKSEISRMDVDIGGAALTIKQGDQLSVESDINGISVSSSGGTLKIKQSGIPFQMGRTAGVVIITLPDDIVFDMVSIVTGAGRVNIDTIASERAELEFGAGEVKIKSLTATKGAEIDGGAGQITIEGGEIHELDFDMGVGEFTLTSRLTGRNTFDMGVGEANITLIGSTDDHRVAVGIKCQYPA